MISYHYHLLMTCSEKTGIIERCAYIKTQEDYKEVIQELEEHWDADVLDDLTITSLTIVHDGGESRPLDKSKCAKITK